MSGVILDLLELEIITFRDLEGFSRELTDRLRDSLAMRISMYKGN